MGLDKVINNSYNNGDSTYEDFTSSIKLDPIISGLYEDQLGDNITEHRVMNMLNDEMYKIFLDSQFYEKYKKPKRIDKGDMIKIYYYFKEILVKQNKFSSIEIFKCIAEFFQFNYDTLYSEIGTLDKEQILHEISEKYSIEDKIKIKRLF